MVFASIAAPAGTAVVFRSSCFNGQAAEACSYAALIGPVAAIRTHRRTGLAAVIDSHCCTGPAAAIVARDPAVEVRSNGRVPF